MKNGEFLRGVDDAEKTLNNLLVLLTSNAKEQVIGKFIRNSQVQKRIISLKTSGDHGVKIVPLLLQILQHPETRKYHSIIAAIVSFLGFLKPDGRITGYTFSDIVLNTQFTGAGIYDELMRKKYIGDHSLTSRFRPLAPDFVFDLDPEFEPIKEQIKSAVLSASGDIPACKAILSLLKDPELSPVYPDIIAALSGIRHPIAFPRLLDLAAGNHESAKKALINMALEDIAELKALFAEGVTEDLWKNNLAEKAGISLKPLFPLLLESFQSAGTAPGDKKLICFLFGQIDTQWDTEIRLFVQSLPILYEKEAAECGITRLLIKTGKSAIPFITDFLQAESVETDAFKRFLFILESIDPDKERLVHLLNNLIMENPLYTAPARELFPLLIADTPANPEDTAEKYEAEIAVQAQKATQGNETISPDPYKSDKETALSIEEVKKEDIDTDPEEYILY